MKNPIILESGPFAHNGICYQRAADYGYGAVTSETITLRDGTSPRWHMMNQGESLLNCSRWSDISIQKWMDEEIPRMNMAGCAAILSLGHSLEEIQKLVPLFATTTVDGFKLVSYNSDELAEMVKFAKSHTDKPVWAKISPNWEDPVRVAMDCANMGADAIVAIDTFGQVPVPQKPQVPISTDTAWLSGSAIHALALYLVKRISSRISIDVIGVGGIRDSASLERMREAGAKGFGVCTAVIQEGLNVIDKLLLGGSIAEQYNSYSVMNHDDNSFGSLKLTIDNLRCNDCGLCVDVCGYKGWENTELGIIHTERCRGCGWCIQKCPCGAIVLDI